MYPQRESSGVFVYPPLEMLKWHKGPLPVLDEDCRHMRQAVIYIHIPFCISFCSFCSFYRSRALKRDEEAVERYVQALEREMALYASTPYVHSMTFGTVYFGGGTPTCLSARQLERLLRGCRENFSLSDDVQITVEGNASSLDPEKLSVIRANGCNRISLGVQTFDRSIGEDMRLPHTGELVRKAVREARAAGHKNISIDLIYDFPGETPEIWKKDLQSAFDLELDHITVFCLHAVPGTLLWKQVKEKNLALPGTGKKAMQLYDTAIERLCGAGYRQESLTDFFRPGVVGYKYGQMRAESADVLAMGTGSNGSLHNVTYRNIRTPEEYTDCVSKDRLPVEYFCGVSPKERMHGFMAKGLRHMSVDKGAFRRRFGKEMDDVFKPIVERLKAKGLIKEDDRSIYLTPLGVLWGGNVCREFYSHEIQKQGD